MTRTLTVLNTSNAKTGKVAVSSYRTQESCPPTCSMMAPEYALAMFNIVKTGGGGCYANNHGIGGSATPFGHAGRGEEGLEKLMAEFAKLKPGDVVRLNVSGDYLLADQTPDWDYITACNSIPFGVLTISYTHAWRLLDPSWFQPHVRPNASCDTPQDIVDAIAAGWQTVVVDPGDLAGTTIGGRKVVSCVFETKKIQCKECGLCGRDRAATVSFRTHGARKRKASEALLAARELTHA